MPYEKLFPPDLDSSAFAIRYGLDPCAVAARAAHLSSERETYHGCRGIRLFCIRPEIASLWLSTLLLAARDVRREGCPLRLRILLATVTLPEEVRAFLSLYEETVQTILRDPGEVVEGISVMLETAGAYLTLEEIEGVHSRTQRITGALIGSNDFTAACLNFNRADSPRTIIPGYVDAGLLEHSPFHRLHEGVVGKAILASLQRSRAGRAPAGRHLWGFGGELAGDWDSVRWLAAHAAPLGLHYVSTTPEQMPVALFAAAQESVRSSLRSGGGGSADTRRAAAG